MLGLYPSIKPFHSEHLEVGYPHRIYLEQCGDPEGLPVLILHGGPGSGCDAMHRRLFDPEKYRIILLDQRGCGHSTPHAELHENHTQALLADINQVRQHLGIEQWVIYGDAWGSTLALLYAQAHPDYVSGLILQSVFLARKCDREWLYQHGANQIFPDYWQDFINHLTHDERHNVINAYYELLTSSNELARMSAAKEWANWTAQCATLQPHDKFIQHFTDPCHALSYARIACHYALHDYFLTENQILPAMHCLEHVPCIIIHGRYDMVYPVQTAWTLHQAYPASELIIIREAGHAASESGIIDAVIHAGKKLITQLQ
ncbi:MAG: prolyl aminopeptidase [Gammaproteobacteria bacterium]